MSPRNWIRRLLDRLAGKRVQAGKPRKRASPYELPRPFRLL